MDPEKVNHYAIITTLFQGVGYTVGLWILYSFKHT